MPSGQKMIMTIMKGGLVVGTEGAPYYDDCDDHDYGVDDDDDVDGDDDDDERWFSGWHGGSSTLGTDLDAHDFFPPIIEIMRRRIHYPCPSIYSKQHCTTFTFAAELGAKSTPSDAINCQKCQ